MVRERGELLALEAGSSAPEDPGVIFLLTRRSRALHRVAAVRGFDVAVAYRFALFRACLMATPHLLDDRRRSRSLEAIEAAACGGSICAAESED